MASELRVNTINSRSGLGTITVSDTGAVFTGITTIGSVTVDSGTVTGNLTGNVTGNLTGTASTATASATAYGLSGSPTLSGITSVSTTNLTVNGNAYPAAGPLSNRNRWINGAMTIDQRRAGSSQTNAASGDYVVDRLRFEGENSKCTVGQNLNSVTPPVGFKNYAGVEVTTTHTPTSSQHFNISRWIEGYNVDDFELGTANAKQFTISFWVRSSVTGTYGLSLLGYDGSSTFRSYIREYTIDSANTWEHKTLTIQGDTSTAITWGTTNDAGLFVSWALGFGSGLTTTADTWTTGLYRSTSNQTNLFATSGATFYLTGVQVEVGSVATPFEHRSFGDELARCQRYYVKTFDYSTAPAQNLGAIGSLNFVSQGNILFDVMWRYPVELRAQPTTVTTYSTNAASANWSTNTDTPTASTFNIGTLGMAVRANTPATGGRAYFIHATAEAEL